MGYSAAGKNLMLDALGAAITYVGILEADAALTSVTITNAGDILTKASHGLSNGNLVVITELTGGAGIIAGNANNADEAARAYYIVGVNGNDFQLAEISGGSAITITSDGSCKVTRLVEITGGSPAYAHKAIAWNAAANGSMDDSTNGAVFDMPASSTADYVGFFSALTNGTLYAIDKSTGESFVGQGTLTLTDADIDLNAGA